MDELLLSEKQNFISSSEAAFRYDCSLEYIGRLCRQGKLKGILVGRTWQVDVESLTALIAANKPERLQAAQVLARAPKRAEFVSSAEAAQRYECSPEYIGRLCRQGKLRGVLTGRVWQVEVASLNALIAEKKPTKLQAAEELAKVRREEYIAHQREIKIAQEQYQPLGRFYFEDELVAKSSASVSKQKTPQTIFLQKALTAFAAIVFVFGGVEMVRSGAPIAAYQELVALLSGAQDGASGAPHSFSSQVAAVYDSLTHIQSDFFAPAPSDGTGLWSRAAAGLQSKLAALFGQPTQTIPTPPGHGSLTTVAPKNTPVIVQNTSTSSTKKVVHEVTTTRTVVTKVVENTIHTAGVEKSYVDSQIEALRSSLSSEIYRNSSSQYPSIPNFSQSSANTAISQRIDTLNGVTITNGHFNGVEGLTDADIPNDLTASNYLPLTGGTLTGTLTVSTTSTSTFSGPVVASAFQITGLTNCDTTATDAEGNLICGFGGSGGGADGNWVYFNHSGIKLATTTNQVLIGANSTTSLAKLEVRGDAYISGNLGVGTTSPYASLSVAGATGVVANIYTATSTSATSTLPNLSTTNLAIGSDYVTALTGGGLTIVNGVLTASGGSGFSTTSANYWASLGLAFSTTSNDYYKSVNNFFSTSSADFYSAAGLAFSSTSATNFISQAVNQGLAFSTTSATYFLSQANVSGFSTTSANYWSTLGLGWATSSANAYSAAGLAFSTTSNNYWSTLGLGFATSSADAWQGTKWFNTYPFINSATSSTLTFTGGIVTVGSTTVNGNATTTGTFFATTASSTNLYGAGLTSCNGSTFLQWNAGLFGCGTPGGSGSSFSTTSANYWASLGLAFSTTSEDYYKSVNNFFSTTSANYWSTLGLGFSTTSASYFASAGLAFSTTSADVWRSVRNFFSTTSADYYTSLGLSFSTTSSNAWASYGLGFSTTSTSYFSSLGLAFSTTSTDYWKSVSNFFSTTSATYFSSLGLAWATSSANAYRLANNFFATSSAAYWLQNGAAFSTTTDNIFTGANMFLASTTIGAGNQTTGLTVLGGATTTGNAYFAGNVGIGIISPLEKLHINGRATADSFAVGQSNNDYTNNAPWYGVGLSNVTLGDAGNASQTVQLGGYYGIELVTAGGAYSFTQLGKVGIGSTTPGSVLSIGDTGNDTINISATATSTFGSGVNIRTGCFAINGTCLSTSNATDIQFSTTSANYWSSLGLGFSTTSAANYFINGLAFSTTTNNTWTGANIFQASTTIGGGTLTTGLTISGGATTTGNAYFAGTGRFIGNLSINTGLCTGGQALQADSNGNIVCATIASGGSSTGGGWTTNNIGDVTLATTSDRIGLGATSTPYAKLSILSGGPATTTLALLPASGQTANIIDIYNTSGALASVLTSAGYLGLGTTSPFRQFSASGSGVFGDNVLASTFTATSTSATSTLPNLSTTNLAVGSDYISDITGSGLSIVNGALTATGSSFSTTSADYYKSQNSEWKVVGNSYLTPTSTLQSIIAAASSTIGNGTQAGGLTISGGATTTANAYFAGNVGVGTTSPFALLSLGTPDGASGSQRTLFAIASSTQQGATTTILKIANDGSVTLNTGNNGIFMTAGSTSWSVDQSGMAIARSTSNPGQIVVNGSSTGNATATGGAGIVINTTALTSSPSTNFSSLLINPATMGATGANYFISAHMSTKFQDGFYVAASSTLNTKVGIASSSPYAKLSIQANNGDASAVALFAIGSSTSNSTTTLFSIDNTGSTTAANGFNITAGCFAVGGVCLPNSSFSTTSADYYTSLGLSFSTTSANYWSLAGLGFSTTSNNYYSSLGLAWATSSANAYSAAGLAFSTTSADVWKGLRNFFSTTSADYYTSLGLSFSTTSANAYSAAGLAFSTTSSNYWSTLGLGFSTTSAANYFINGLAFSTTTNNTFTGANIFNASTTIGAGATTTGLTISGGATTTGQHVFLSNIGIGTTSPWAALTIATPNRASGSSTTLFLIASSTSNSTTTLFSINNTGSTTAANGFNITAGCFAVNGICLSSFSTTSANYWSTLGLGFSTTSANFWGTTGSGFSTTSSNYWASLGLGWATSSANAYSAAGLAFSTTSSNYYTSLGLSFSTTSSNAWASYGLGFSTTSSNYWGTTGSGFSTTSSNYWASLGLAFSTTSADYYKSQNSEWKIVGNSYLTPTSTLQSFIAAASSTIGNGTQAGGLTISGGATTTGTAYIAGRLGIGTSSPNQSLDVIGGAVLTTNPNVLPAAFQSLGSNASVHIGSYTGGYGVVQGGGVNLTTGSYLLLNPAGGNVGVGTFGGGSPASSLTVGAGASIGAAYFTTAAPTNGLIVQGNVGIGTTSPFAKLSVAGGNLHVGGTITATSTATSSFTGGIDLFAINQTGSATSTFANGITLAGGCFSLNGSCLSSFSTTSADYYKSQNSEWKVVGNSYLTPTSTLQSFIATASSTIGAGGQTTGLTISGGATTTGNLRVNGSGIFAGAVPSQTATVVTLSMESGYGQLQSWNSQPLYINPLGNNTILNRDGGNVGIATTVPSGTLALGGSQGVSIFLDSGATRYDTISTGNTNGVLTFVASTDNNSASVGAFTFNAKSFNNVALTRPLFDVQNRGASKFFINGAGNTGIGTTSPLAKLSVHANDGDTNTTLFAVASSTADATTTLLSINNVGVAEFKPYGLDGSTFIGLNAGYESGNAELSNFIGKDAGNGAVDTAGANFFGFQAGKYATTTPYSNFMGYQAGTEAGAATYSNFFGAGAGAGAIGAAGSNFIGFAAGNNASTSIAANFIGYQAGYLAANALYSNFIGYQAGAGTAAIGSNFFGYGAGVSAINAGGSNFLGVGAGQEAANARNSVFIGYHAGYQDTVNNLDDGKSSILLGDYTSTGGFSNSIAIGQGTANNAAQQLNLGGVLYATGISNAVAPSAAAVVGGKIGVGTTTPAQTLSVQGSGLLSGNLSIAGLTATSTLTVTGTGTSTFAGNVAVANVLGIGNSSTGFNAYVDDGLTRLSINPLNTGYGATFSTSYLETTGILGAGGSSINTLYGVNWNTSLNFKIADAGGTFSEVGRFSPQGRFSLGSTTPGTILSIGNTGNDTINISATATSTFGSGINIRTGCFAINGTCLSTGGSSASSTLLTDTNRWTGSNIFAASTTIGAGNQAGGLTISGGATTTGTAYFASNIGIGTTSPFASLSVTTAATTGVGSVLDLSTITSGTGLYIPYTSAAMTSAGRVLRIRDTTNSADMFEMNEFGLVGIRTFNTLDPVGASLTVATGFDGFKGIVIRSNSATQSANLAEFQNSSSQAINVVTPSFSVGIGTSTPYAQLSINTPYLATGATTTLFAIASSTSNSTTTLFTLKNTGILALNSNYFSCGALNSDSSGIIGCAAASSFFSTTSANYWSTLGLGFSTTSANYWGTTGSGFSTTSSNYWAAAGLGFSTTSASNFFRNGLAFSTTTNNIFTGTNMLLASTTIGAGAQTTGLTISGGATTTGNQYIAGTLGVGVTSQSGAKFYVSGGQSRFENGGVDTASAQIELGVTAAPSNYLQKISTSHSAGTLANNSLSISLSNIAGVTIANPFLTVRANNTSGFGTSSPFATLSVQANNGETNQTLFAIASSTSNSTTTLFSISNTGSTTAANGINVTAGCFSVNSVCLSSFSTTSANFWSTLGLGFSTTSANFWGTTGSGFSTTSANLWSTFGLGFSTTSANYYKSQISEWKVVGNSYLTPTSTLQSFIAAATSTIGNGTQAGGLTISGGATTTGNVYVAGLFGIGTSTPRAKLSISATNLSNTWAQVGSALSISGATSEAIAAVAPNRVALIDSVNDSLRMYEFNGTAWSLIGSGLSVSGISNTPALAALSPNRVAFIDDTNDSLRTYEFTGTTWVQVGNGLTISTVGNPSITALSPNRIAFLDATNISLRVYEFNGTAWSLVGSGTTITGSTGSLYISALSPNRVALVEDTTDTLRTYDFNGTNWRQVGSSFSLTAFAQAGVTALTQNRVAFTDLTNDTLKTYQFDGNTWAPVGTGLTFTVNGPVSIAALSPNRIAYIAANEDTLRTYQFSNPLLYVADTNDYPFFAVSDAGYTTAESMGVRTTLTVGQSATTTWATSSPALIVYGNSTFSGMVGIGTTSPFAQLTVLGNSTATSSLLFAVGSSTATNFVITNAGNVGIGTTSPQFQLALSGGKTRFKTTTNTADALAVENSVGTTTFSVSTLDTSENLLSVGTSTNLSYFDITAAGNVGISSSTPFGLLSVGQSTESASLWIGGTGSTSPSLMVAGLNGNGRVGIGTTTIGTSSTAVLLVNNNRANAVASFSNSSGTCFINPTTSSLSCSSDIRLKKNVTTLSASLAAVLALRPVTYNWNAEAPNTPGHSGFIAQEVQALMPDLVNSDDYGYLQLNYAGFTPYLVNAIQDIASSTAFARSLTSVSELTVNTSSSTAPWVGALSGASSGFKNLLAQFNEATVHLFKDVIYASTAVFNKVFAKEVHTDTLCITDTTGETCVTKSQLDTLLAGASASVGGNTTTTTTTTTSTATGTSTADTTAPVISMSGANPATIHVGDTYSDLGASVSDDVSANLQLYAALDGGEVRTADQLYINTSAPGTHTIVYSATDAAGNVGTATRTVHVEDAFANTNTTTSTTTTTTITETTSTSTITYEIQTSP